MADEFPVQVPADLTEVGEEELRELEEQATNEFVVLNGQDDVTAETLERLSSLADDLDRLREEIGAREEHARVEAERQKAYHAERKSFLRQRVFGPNGEEREAGENGGALMTSVVDPESLAAATARGVTASLFTMLGEQGAGGTLADLTAKATASLADVKRHAPVTPAPKPRLAVTAGIEIPGVPSGSELSNFDALINAVQRKVKSMPVSREGIGVGGGATIATIRNEFTNTVDDRTKPSQIEELFRDITSPERQEALVAGGGWCAPSEIRYDFFNVACEDGLVDLPEFGVTRGGIQFPVSPSLASVDLAPFAVPMSSGSNPWLWTETDDIATVTGSPNKPCIRVPCPTFEERRLECYGLCLTAGNLTDDAYPEATANFLRLLLSAHTHAMNARYLATMETLSETCVTGGAFAVTGGPAFNSIVGGAALAATDYRARFGMCEDDVLELILPQWVVGVIQADLARRTGVDNLLSATRNQIRDFFAARNIRVQFVNDWQVRGTGQFGADASMTAWPTSVNIMLYAAGTFVKGNGLTLDLGVVRDSVLNAENDHTAAWSEECHLIARVGHESRCYTINFAVAGDTCCDTAGGVLA